MSCQIIPYLLFQWLSMSQRAQQAKSRSLDIGIRITYMISHLTQLTFNEWTSPSLSLKRVLANEVGITLQTVNMWMFLKNLFWFLIFDYFRWDWPSTKSTCGCPCKGDPVIFFLLSMKDFFNFYAYRRKAKRWLSWTVLWTADWGKGWFVLQTNDIHK